MEDKLALAMCRISRVVVIAFGLLTLGGILPLNGQVQFGADQCRTEQPLSTQDRKELQALHLPSGVPSHGHVRVRRAYVTEYDASRRLPRWAAWFATKAFLDQPKRKGRWKRFHPDPDVRDAVTGDDYKGVFDRGKGFARGHIVPHYISGGDRDGDGLDAELEGIPGLPVEDPYDACTVFEVNYMSNVVPQYHIRFNGSGGLWYKLETALRQAIGNGRDLHVIAGPVFVSGPVRKIGPQSVIHVPHGFFKIVIFGGTAVAFLFAHDERVDAPGCPLSGGLTDCIVSIEKIEKVTGLDFFAALPAEAQLQLESTPNEAAWLALTTAAD